jgi:hypothetical protein
LWLLLSFLLLCWLLEEFLLNERSSVLLELLLELELELELLLCVFSYCSRSSFRFDWHSEFSF